MTGLAAAGGMAFAGDPSDDTRWESTGYDKQFGSTGSGIDL